LDEILMFLPRKRFCQAIYRYMADRYPSNFDAVIGNLFPQLILANIYVFKFGNEG
jgi:hypothetical protein